MITTLRSPILPPSLDTDRQTGAALPTGPRRVRLPLALAKNTDRVTRPTVCLVKLRVGGDVSIRPRCDDDGHQRSREGRTKRYRSIGRHRRGRHAFRPSLGDQISAPGRRDRDDGLPTDTRGQ